MWTEPDLHLENQQENVKVVQARFTWTNHQHHVDFSANQRQNKNRERATFSALGTGCCDCHLSRTFCLAPWLADWIIASLVAEHCSRRPRCMFLSLLVMTKINFHLLPQLFHVRFYTHSLTQYLIEKQYNDVRTIGTKHNEKTGLKKKRFCKIYQQVSEIN